MCVKLIIVLKFLKPELLCFRIRRLLNFTIDRCESKCLKVRHFYNFIRNFCVEHSRCRIIEEVGMGRKKSLWRIMQRLLLLIIVLFNDWTLSLSFQFVNIIQVLWLLVRPSGRTLMLCKEVSLQLGLIVIHDLLVAITSPLSVYLLEVRLSGHSLRWDSLFMIIG